MKGLKQITACMSCSWSSVCGAEVMVAEDKNMEMKGT
jgi:hypothetical protein